MEAKFFRGTVEEIPPSRAHVSAATWLIPADCFNQQNACRDVCFPSVSCAIKIYWRFLFLSRHIQTNQAYFTRLKAHNRDDYVSIYRLHGGSSVWLLNFVFSLLIYFASVWSICFIILYVVIRVGTIFGMTAPEVGKTPWGILQSPVFKDVISTLIDLQGNDPAFPVSVPKCPLHIGKERTQVCWKKQKRMIGGEDSGQWGEVLTLKRREISQ